MGQDKKRAKDEVPVLFRIHSHTEDLDLSLVRGILGDARESPFVERSYEDADEGIAGLEFRDTPPLENVDEGEKWQRPAFRNLVQWLRTKSEGEIESLRRAGNKADVCIGPHLGRVPQDLLDEIIRLKLELWLIPINTGDASPK